MKRYSVTIRRRSTSYAIFHVDAENPGQAKRRARRELREMEDDEGDSVWCDTLNSRPAIDAVVEIAAREDQQ